jgi:hypothetical protein
MSKKQSGSKSSSVGSDVWNSDAPAHNCSENDILTGLPCNVEIVD